MMAGAYTWLKFLHVAGAAGWLGGFAAIAVINLLATRNADAKEVGTFLRYGRAIGAWLGGPASGLALLTGIAAVFVGRLAMPLWVVWGLVATAVFVAIGVAGLRPALNRLVAAAERGAGADELRDLLRRQRLLLTANLLVLLSAIWAMVFKPT